MVESKRDDLINKIGLSEGNADILFELFGGRSIWMAKKIIDSAMLMYGLSKEDAIKRINDDNSVRRNREKLVSIKDFMVVGLDGRFDPVKNLTFDELYDKSVRWHKSLKAGGPGIDYEEKNDIIIDMRDSDGIGYYWVDLGTNDCKEESRRMGHCGRTSSGTLYSLRSYEWDLSGEVMANRSHLTASIGDGIVYQLKGPENEEPEAEYHPYIMALLKHRGRDGDYFVKEFENNEDFMITDLNDGYIRELYKYRPDLFTSIPAKLKLVKLGLMDRSDVNTKFKLKIKFNEISNYFDAKDWAGSELNNSIFGDILTGNIDYDVDVPNWNYILDRYVSSENEGVIESMLNKKAEGMGIDIEDMNLEEAIDALDYDEIRNDLVESYKYESSSAMESAYVESVRYAIENEYGYIDSVDDKGIIVTIDLTKFNIDYKADDDFECDEDDLECLFKEITIYNPNFDKPKYYLPDVWDFNDDNFNDMLKERLSEIG